MMLTGNRTLKVAKYCLLPQILPRFANLVFGGFSYLAYFIAQVYRGVRLLPEGHLFLNPSSIGTFSIPDVVGAAGKQLKYRKEYIDQIIIYYVILLGMVLIAFQTLLLLIGLFAPQAMALSLGDYFGNAHLTVGVDRYQDLAFIMLDRVFGVPGIFDSCVSIATPCYMAAPNLTWANATQVYTPPIFPWPFHNALHAMFGFYSTGLLIIGLMILLYLVIVVVAETAQTGVPFGKRYNKVWAPIRLVVALGLLIPISNGLNSAQYIVLYAAKLGSNFATNGWVLFNDTLATNRLTSENIIAFPKTPTVAPLLQFMMLAHACKAVNEGYLIQNKLSTDWTATPYTDCQVNPNDQMNDSVIQAYLVRSTANSTTANALTLETQDYAAARTFFNNGDITIRFGDRGCSEDHTQYSGNTEPVCGELVLPTTSQEAAGSGSYVIQKGYYDLIRYMWGQYGDSSVTSSGSNPNPAHSVRIWDYMGFCNTNIGGVATLPVLGYQTKNYADMTNAGPGDAALRNNALSKVQELCDNKILYNGTEYSFDPSIQNDVTLDWVSGTYNNYMYGLNDAVAPGLVTASASYSPGGTASAIMTNIVRSGVVTERAATKYNMPIDLIDRGWAGAGLWYNEIARANGAITGAVQATPKIVRYPEMMKSVAAAKSLNNKNVSLDDLFTAIKGEDSSLNLSQVGMAAGVVPMQQIYSLWKEVGNEYKPATGNSIFDFLNALFGTQGLFDLRDPGNQDVHPLALMSSMGKSLIEASIRNLGLAVGGNILGSVAGNNSAGLEVSAQTASSLLFLIINMTLGAGIILYYVLPFMPFVYFFFALGSWIKEVFEAMVGVPLWALAHLRIDGDGLPGEAARSGYFMIFEIFLRPMMILFGLLAAVSIFAAMASVLNSVFTIAVVNAGGTNFGNATSVNFTEFARGPIDQLFYTILYAVLMYIIAMSSFKMIDLIPNQVMRWLGVSINTFASQTGDSAQQLMSNAQQQGLGKVDQAMGGIQSTSKGAGDAIKSATS